MGPTKPISRTMLVLVVGVSVLGNHWVAAQTLQGAVHETLISNPDILSAKAKEQAAYQDILQARGAYFPVIDATAGIGEEYSNNPFTRSTNDPAPILVRKESQLILSQLLYDGGNVSNTVEQRKYDWKTSEYQLAEIRENLAFLTAASYLNVLRNRELVDVSYRSVTSHQHTLNDVSRLLKAGAGLKSDLELAEGRLARAKAELEITRQALMDSELTYIKLVGMPIPEVMEPPTAPSNIPDSLPQAQEVATQYNPALLAALAQFNASGAAIGVAKSAFYPRFSIDANTRYSNNIDGVVGYNKEARAMLTMSYNLFRGGSDVAAVKAATDRQAAAQYTIVSVQRSVDEQVGNAWNQLETTNATIPQFKKYSADSWDVFRAYQKQYQLGQRTLFDLLDAETEHYDALRLYINARYDEKTSNYQLLSSMGNLVSTMAYSHLDKPEFVGQEELDDEPVSQGDPLPELIPDPDRLVETPPSSNDPNPIAQPPVPLVNKISANNADRFTIQLMASRDKTTLDDFINNNNLKGKVHYYSTVVDGQEWYRLVYGDYNSPETAWAAIDTIPHELQNFEPMVRSFASVRGEG